MTIGSDESGGSEEKRLFITVQLEQRGRTDFLADGHRICYRKLSQ